MRARRDYANILETGEDAEAVKNIKVFTDKNFVERYRIVSRLGSTENAVFMKTKRIEDDRTRMLVLMSNLSDAQMEVVKRKLFLYSTFEIDQTIK